MHTDHQENLPTNEKQNHSMEEPSTSIVSILRPILVSAVLFMLITGIGYPLVVTGVAQLLLSRQANGSLIEQEGRPIGSDVIGQHFTRPEYFHGRPSETLGPDPQDPSKTIANPYNGGLSAASNQGVLSKTLKDTIVDRTRKYREENDLTASVKIPVDAVTASASGLDPDISVANALLQAGRVAKTRGISRQEVESLLRQTERGPQFGILGTRRINVLQLNLALEQNFPMRRSSQ